MREVVVDFRTLAPKGLRSQARKLGSLLDRCPRAWDAEYVHKLRVECRRLICVLDVFADLFTVSSRRKWKRKLKHLVCDAGAARDRDVQIARVHRWMAEEASGKRAGAGALLRRLLHDRVCMQEGIEKSVKGVVASRLLDKMVKDGRTRYCSIRLQDMRCRAYRLLARRLDAIGETVTAFSRIDEQRQHELRISVRKLRYTMELILPAGKRTSIYLDGLSRMQSLLGTMNDCRTLVDELPCLVRTEKTVDRLIQPGMSRSRGAAELESAAKALACSERRRWRSSYGDFRGFCMEARRNGFWNGLRTEIELIARDCGQSS